MVKLKEKNEEMNDIYDKLNDKNKEVIKLLAKGMEVSEKINKGEE